MLSEINYENINPAKWTTDKEKNEMVKQLLHNYSIKVNDLTGLYKRRKFSLTVGDELPAGIMRMAKVYVAKKRKLKVGDKMAGNLSEYRSEEHTSELQSPCNLV